MVLLAKAYLESARMNHERGPLQSNVAYDEARHAAEVAGKALYLAKNGSELVADHGKGRGRGHAIGGQLAQGGLIPEAVSERALSKLLRSRNRGAYGFFDTVEKDQITDAIQIASAMIAAAEGWPDGRFHPPHPRDAEEDPPRSG